MYKYNKIYNILMRDERRKEERRKQGQTSNKAKQHSTPKAVTFPKKNELPQCVYIYRHIYKLRVCMRIQLSCLSGLSWWYMYRSGGCGFEQGSIISSLYMF